MLNIDLKTNTFEMDGDIHTVAKEIVMALGTLCDEYNKETKENITPYQLIDLGVYILQEETK